MTTSDIGDLSTILMNSLNKDIDRLDKNNKYKEVVELSEDDIINLYQKINLLPIDYRNILLSKYCFDMGPDKTGNVFNIEDVKIKCKAIEILLSELIGLDGEKISYESFEKSCNLVLDNEMEDTYIEPYSIKYSKKFKQKLSFLNLDSRYKKIIWKIGKSVAIFMIVGILSFTSVLLVNVEARDNFQEWFIERFKEFSVISSNPSNILNEISFENIKTNYIPKGFTLKDKHEGRSMMIYEYIDNDNKHISIKFCKGGENGKSYYDTEDSQIEEININGNKGFKWNRDSIEYLIWEDNGIEYHISGKIEEQEILNIGENISY